MIDQLETIFRNKQVRFTRQELVTEELEGKKYLRGYAMLFNTPATPIRGLDEYREEISPEALNGVDLSDCRVLINHDNNLIIGRAGKNARIEADNTGLFVEVEIHSGVQYAKDYYNMVKAGILDGMSFHATAPRSALVRDENTGVYRITQFSELIDVSFVAFPAYEQTAAIARDQQEAVVGLEPAPKAEPEIVTKTNQEAAPSAGMGLEPGQEEQGQEPQPVTVDAQIREKVIAELEALLGGKTTNA